MSEELLEHARRGGETAFAELADGYRAELLLHCYRMTGSVQDGKVMDALQALAEHDKPWVLAGAVVGISMVKRMLFKMVTMMSGRKLATFASQDDAKEWLVKQWVPPTSVPDIVR